MMPTVMPTAGTMNKKMTPRRMKVTPTAIMGPQVPRLGRLKLALDHDEALLRHLAHGPGGAFFRVAPGLDAAVRHLVAAGGGRFVDDHASALQPGPPAPGPGQGGGEEP